jgi:uncharacterized protein YndB with AHSA1/START domain
LQLVTSWQDDAAGVAVDSEAATTLTPAATPAPASVTAAPATPAWPALADTLGAAMEAGLSHGEPAASALQAALATPPASPRPARY